MSNMKTAFPREVQTRILAGFEGASFARMDLSEFTDRGFGDPTLEALKERLPGGAWVAGGCFESLIRGDKPKDYDLFFIDEEAFMETLRLLTHFNESTFEKGHVEEPATGYSVANLSDPNAMMHASCRFVDLERVGHPKIQLIKTMWYPSLEHVLDSFDFTAAQIGMDKKGITLNPLAPIDISRKRLVLNRMTFPSSTLRRMIKYTQKGYYACPGALQQIAIATQETLTKAPDSNGVVYVD